MGSFGNVCRLCSSSVNESGVDLFTQQNQYLQQIRCFFKLQLLDGENVPKKVCDNCVYELENITVFKERCIQTQKSYEIIYKKSYFLIEENDERPVQNDTASTSNNSCPVSVEGNSSSSNTQYLLCGQGNTNKNNRALLVPLQSISNSNDGQSIQSVKESNGVQPLVGEIVVVNGQSYVLQNKNPSSQYWNMVPVNNISQNSQIGVIPVSTEQLKSGFSVNTSNLLVQKSVNVASGQQMSHASDNQSLTAHAPQPVAVSVKLTKNDSLIERLNNQSEPFNLGNVEDWYSDSGEIDSDVDEADEKKVKIKTESIEGPSQCDSFNNPAVNVELVKKVKTEYLDERERLATSIRSMERIPSNAVVEIFSPNDELIVGPHMDDQLIKAIQKEQDRTPPPKQTDCDKSSVNHSAARPLIEVVRSGESTTGKPVNRQPLKNEMTSAASKPLVGKFTEANPQNTSIKLINRPFVITCNKKYLNKSINGKNFSVKELLKTMGKDVSDSAALGVKSNATSAGTNSVSQLPTLPGRVQSPGNAMSIVRHQFVKRKVKRKLTDDDDPDYHPDFNRQCFICDKIFTTYASYQRHMRTHRVELRMAR